MTRTRKALVLLAVLPGSALAQTLDGVSVEEGRGSQSSITKLTLQDDWGSDSSYLREHGLRTYWEGDIAELHSRKCHDVQGESQIVNTVGITPVLRWNNVVSQSVFGEIGIGANYMSEQFSANNRIMGTRFQFGDHVAVGFVFNNGVELSLKFQHYSNAGIREPNPAINFGIVKLTYLFKP